MATLRRSRVFRMLLLTALGSILLMTALPGLAFGLPLVAITRPTNGATVSGVIWIDVAFRSDSNRPITRLEIYVDDVLSREVDLATPLLEGRQSFNWDFSYSQNTTHKISARAIDSANAAGSASVTVQVQSAAVGGPDVIPPVVRIYYPAQGAKLQGLVEVKADATDNVGVESVYFYVDGKLHKMMMNAPPYVDSWDTRRDADGVHVLEAVAVDAAELEARSAQVTVIVENHSLTTMGGLTASGPRAQSSGAVVNPAPPAPTPVVEPAPAPPVVAAMNSGTVEVAPRINPVPVENVPAPPSVSAALLPGSPVGISTTHNDHLTAAPAPGAGARTSVPTLTRPGTASALPGGAPSVVSASKPSPTRQLPTLARQPQRVAGPAPTQAAQSLEPVRVAPGTSSEPRHLAATPARPAPATLSPATAAAPRLAPADRGSISLAKSQAPLGTLSAQPAARTSTPAPITAAKVAPQPTPRVARMANAPAVKPAPDVQRITPVGPAVAVQTPAPREVRPLTKLVPVAKATPVAGLSRVTVPAPAKTQTASVARPALSTAAISQAALAEYRGLPVPASRMLAMLPATPGARPAAGKITTPAQASAAVPLAIQTVRDIKIVFDGEVLSLRTAPDTRQGISIAPLREIFEKTDGVLYWFPVEGQVRAVNKDVDMKLKIGDKRVDVNGEVETLQIAPYIKQGRTMVPLQFIADVLDVKIAFDNRTGQILISSNQF